MFRDRLLNYARREVRSSPVRDGLAIAGITYGLLTAFYDVTYVSYMIAKAAASPGVIGAAILWTDDTANRVAEAWAQLTHWLVALLGFIRINVPLNLLRYVAPVLLVLPRASEFTHDLLIVSLLGKSTGELRRLEHEVAQKHKAELGRRRRAAEDEAGRRAGVGAVLGGIIGAAVGGPVGMAIGIGLGSIVGAKSVDDVADSGSSELDRAAKRRIAEEARLQSRIRRFLRTRSLFLATAIGALLLALAHLADSPFERSTSSKGAGCQKWETGKAPADFHGRTYSPNESCACKLKNGDGGPTGYVTRLKNYQPTRAEGLLVCRIVRE